jgi:hypothetical protein
VDYSSKPSIDAEPDAITRYSSAAHGHSVAEPVTIARTSGVKWPGKTLDCAVHPLFGSRDHTRGIYPMSKYTPELQQRLRTTPWCGFDRGKTAACCRFVDQKCQVLMDAWVAFSEGRSTALKADHGARVAAAATLGAPLRFKPTSGPGWSGAGLWDANVNRLAS